VQRLSRTAKSYFNESMAAA
jgi:hypothetical protein